MQEDSLSIVSMIPRNFTNKSPVVPMVCHVCNRTCIKLDRNTKIQHTLYLPQTCIGLWGHQQRGGVHDHHRTPTCKAVQVA